MEKCSESHRLWAGGHEPLGGLEESSIRPGGGRGSHGWIRETKGLLEPMGNILGEETEIHEITF